MKTLELVSFQNDQHKINFEELVSEQLNSRPTLLKRELAVIFTLSAIKESANQELLHPRGCFPQVDVAVKRYHSGELALRDVALFALAMNFHNGQDVFGDFGLEETATPYHFLCLLKDEISVMTEATSIFRRGYRF